MDRCQTSRATSGRWRTKKLERSLDRRSIGRQRNGGVVDTRRSIRHIRERFSDAIFLPTGETLVRLLGESQGSKGIEALERLSREFNPRKNRQCAEVRLCAYTGEPAGKRPGRRGWRLPQGPKSLFSLFEGRVDLAKRPRVRSYEC